MPNSPREQQVVEQLLNAKVTARSQRNGGSVDHAKMAVQRVLEAAAGRYQGSPSVLEGFVAGQMQSKQAGVAPPNVQPAKRAESLQPLDAVKVALAARRRDEFCHGPSRPSWLRRRAEIIKVAMVPPAAPANPGNLPPPFTQPAPPPAPQLAPPPAPQLAPPPAPPPAPMGSAMGPAASDPAAAYAQLMAMIQPKPPVPMAGQGGTGLPTSTPGGEMGGRNTPTTNPIGLMSGLGVDPGGKSVMGNAAFGTKNKVAAAPPEQQVTLTGRTEPYTGKPFDAIGPVFPGKQPYNMSVAIRDKAPTSRRHSGGVTLRATGNNLQSDVSKKKPFPGLQQELGARNANAGKMLPWSLWPFQSPIVREGGKWVLQPLMKSGLAYEKMSVAEYGAAMASGVGARPQLQQPSASATTGQSRAAINRQLAATPKPAPRRGSYTQPASMAVGVPA